MVATSLDSHAFPAATDASRVRAATPATRAFAASLALVCVAAGLTVASAYPLQPLAAMALFVAWTACATWRFSLAWPAAIALVPAVGLATRTGWLAFEEVDLLVLATVAGGYAAIALGERIDAGEPRVRPKLSLLSLVAIGLFFASTVVSLARGIDAAGGFAALFAAGAFDWSAGYDSPLNSIRIFKSLALALLTTPLLTIELRRPGGLDRFGAAMTASLAVGVAFVLQERLAFTGLFDFSDDYRVTGAFWEMHVGGAALDGFLALTIPFAVREALRKASPVRFVAASAVLAAAAYACLVTFSRGVYAAVPLSLALLCVLVARQRVRLDRGALWLVLGKAVVFALVVAFCGALVFRHGGYRATLATFVVVGAAIPVDAALRRIDLAGGIVAVVAAALVAGGTLFVAGALPKGPYLVFTAAFVTTAAAVVAFERRPSRTSAPLVLGAWLWLAAGAVGVARHWGGETAFHDSAVVIAGAVVAVFALARLPRSVWPVARRDQFVTIGIAGVVLGIVAVFTAGAYMGGRFSSTRDDLGVRLAHWTGGIGRLHGADWLFGKGLGRFPATSRYEAQDGTIPGTYGVRHRDGESLLVVTEPRIRYLGFYELFRVSQRVDVEPNHGYDAVLTLRTPRRIAIHVELCEKQLLYAGECRVAEVPVPGDDAWHTVSPHFDSGAIGGTHWFGRRPVFFAIAGGDPDTGVEIRSVRLVDASGSDVLANGRFTNGTARWFSSSDRYHLPWHIKNLVLDVLFDQGLFGLATFALVVGAALLRTALGGARRHPDAPFAAAALGGFLVVGCFDSLLDVPRVALLLYLVVIVALMLRNPRIEAARPASSVPPPPAPAPVPVVDEAAERALRRQRAFGERRRTAV